MKKLELNQMENLEGGAFGDCAFAVVGIIGVGFALASIPATGPVGIAAAGGLIASGLGAGAGIGACTASWIFG